MENNRKEQATRKSAPPELKDAGSERAAETAATQMQHLNLSGDAGEHNNVVNANEAGRTSDITTEEGSQPLRRDDLPENQVAEDTGKEENRHDTDPAAQAEEIGDEVLGLEDDEANVDLHWRTAGNTNEAAAEEHPYIHPLDSGPPNNPRDQAKYFREVAENRQKKIKEQEESLQDADRRIQFLERSLEEANRRNDELRKNLEGREEELASLQSQLDQPPETEILRNALKDAEATIARLMKQLGGQPAQLSSGTDNDSMPGDDPYDTSNEESIVDEDEDEVEVEVEVDETAEGQESGEAEEAQVGESPAIEEPKETGPTNEIETEEKTQVESSHE